MAKQQKRAVLFANGDFPGAKRFIKQIMEDDLLIAVDGGLSHMTRFGLCPDLIIGDLDSANMDDVSFFESQGVEIRKFPRDKNETDLELAIETVLEMNLSTIWVIAALGNRLDQTLASIFLLTRSDLTNVDIRLIDGEQEVFIIRQSALIIGEPGQRISLLPLGGPVFGIHTEGLKYPLMNETLFPDQTRGISNLMTGSTAFVDIQHGSLICIHEMLEPSERSCHHD